MENNPADNVDFLPELLEQMEDDPQIKAAVHAQFTNGDLSFLFTTPQKTARKIITTKPESLILASRRFGKSFISLGICLELAAKKHCISRIYAGTKNALQDIVNDNMSVYEKLAPDGHIKRIKSSYRWIVGPHESEIRLHALDGLSADRNRGGYTNGIALIEEASFINEDTLRNAVESVIIPTFGRHPIKLAYITTAPYSDDNHIWANIKPRAEQNNALFLADVYQNPRFTSERIEEIKTTISEGTFSREYLCIPYIDRSLMVIPEFNPDTHIKPYELPQHYHLTAATDLGGARDKTATLVITYDHLAKTIHVLDELLVEPNTATDEIIPKIKQLESNYQPQKIKRVIDCQPQILTDIRKANSDWSIQLPKKALENKREGKEDQIKNAFRNNQLFIDPKCKKLISTLKSGKWTANRNDWERTEAHGHLDLLAALMYGLRHINRSNPVPDRYGHDPYTHHTPRSWSKSKKSIHELLD